jgi:hypothetical protein
MPPIEYVVIFDGTSARPWGRQMFVPEQPTKPAPPLTSEALFKTIDAASVYAKLQRGDYTVEAMARCLDKPTPDVHRIMQRLYRRDLIAVVDVMAVENPLPGQHDKVKVYGVPSR